MLNLFLAVYFHIVFASFFARASFYSDCAGHLTRLLNPVLRGIHERKYSGVEIKRLLSRSKIPLWRNRYSPDPEVLARILNSNPPASGFPIQKDTDFSEYVRQHFSRVFSGAPQPLVAYYYYLKNRDHLKLSDSHMRLFIRHLFEGVEWPREERVTVFFELVHFLNKHLENPKNTNAFLAEVLHGRSFTIELLKAQSEAKGTATDLAALNNYLATGVDYGEWLEFIGQAGEMDSDHFFSSLKTPRFSSDFSSQHALAWEALFTKFKSPGFLQFAIEHFSVLAQGDEKNKFYF